MVGSGEIVGDIVGPTGSWDDWDASRWKLLLDTHIWLWSTLEPQRLTRRVDKALRNPVNELWLSPVSVGELVVLLPQGAGEAAPRCCFLGR